MPKNIPTATVSVKMRQKKITSGAIQFVELNDAGDPITNPTEGKFGGIYVRKTTLQGASPSEILVSVSW